MSFGRDRNKARLRSRTAISAAHFFVALSILTAAPQSSLSQEAEIPEPLCITIVPGYQEKPGCKSSPMRSCSRETPVVSALFHYFYDYGDKNSERGMTHSPNDWDNFSHRDLIWHEKELHQMHSAGIDFAIVDYQVTPEMVDASIPDAAEKAGKEWVFKGLDQLVSAHDNKVCTDRKTPALGLYLNTTVLDGDSDPTTRNGYNLRHHKAKEFVYHAIASFFCRVPISSWARIDNRPVVFIGSLKHAGATESDIFDYLNQRFLHDFKTELYIIKEREDIDLVASMDPKALRLAEELHRQVKSIEEVHQELLVSDEFYNLSGNSRDEYLMNFYRKLFDQEYIPSLIDPFPLLDFGTLKDRISFAQRFFLSSKMRMVLSRFVAFWYKQYYERLESYKDLADGLDKSKNHDYSLADPIMKTWLSALEVGVNYDQVRSDILASEKFYTKAGHNAEVFIRRLYETIYFRCPNTDEVKFWLDYLADRKLEKELPRTIRKEIALRFLADRESKRMDVSLLMAKYLHRVPGWPGFTDAVFSDSGSKCHEFSSVVSLGPGYDDSNSTYGQPTIVDRRDGSFYSEGWETVLKMNPRPPQVFLQSWNNFRNATEVSRSKEFGYRFVELTKRYTSTYKGGADVVGRRCP